MRDAVDELLGRTGLVASRRELLGVLSRAELDDEIRRGRLARPFRRAYCRPWEADQPDVLERAALISVGQPSALSHLSALHRHGLAQRPAQIHTSVPTERVVRPQPGLVVHRRSAMPVPASRYPLVSVAESVVAPWPLLARHDQRGPAIAAVRTRKVTPARLRSTLECHPNLPGRKDLAVLVDLLAAGCESELEIWGRSAVFDVPGLRHGVPQHRLQVRERVVRLDLAYLDERVAIEMDGDRWHSTREQRERDRRRDALLAAAGWVTLRFSWRRLHFDVAGCRRDALATLASRRVRSTGP